MAGAAGSVGAPRQLVGGSARKLIEGAVEPWKLALMVPAHARYDLCLPCEVGGAAKGMLLAPGALTAPEAAIVREELRGPLAKKRCGHDQLDVPMAIDPDAAFALSRGLSSTLSVVSKKVKGKTITLKVYVPSGGSRLLACDLRCHPIAGSLRMRIALPGQGRREPVLRIPIPRNIPPPLTLRLAIPAITHHPRPSMLNDRTSRDLHRPANLPYPRTSSLKSSKDTCPHMRRTTSGPKVRRIRDVTGSGAVW
jgi:hypothetical protein